MSERPAVSGLPPTSAVKDPAVRSYLDALTQAWLVRNGQTRDTDEKFLTLKDLRDGLDLATRGGGGSGVNPSGNPADSTTGAVAAILAALVESVVNSRLWRELGARIDRIEIPEWFRGRFGAEIRTEQVRQETEQMALARQVTTAITNVNNNVAIARSTIEAQSDEIRAQATIIDQLQVALFGGTSSEQLLSIVNQIRASANASTGLLDGAWSVRMQTVTGNPPVHYVAGVGLGLEVVPGSTPVSSFLVRADRFAVGSPEYPGIPTSVPFIVQTTSDPTTGAMPGVYIDAAFIRYASIDTLRVAGGAITVPLATSGNSSVAATGGWQSIASIPYDGPAMGLSALGGGSVTLYVNATWNALAGAGSDATLEARLFTSGGAERGYTAISLPAGFSGGGALAGVFSGVDGFGVFTIYLQVKAPTNYTWGVYSMFAQVAKR